MILLDTSAIIRILAQELHAKLEETHDELEYDSITDRYMRRIEHVRKNQLVLEADEITLTVTYTKES